MLFPSICSTTVVRPALKLLELYCQHVLPGYDGEDPLTSLRTDLFGTALISQHF